MELEKIRPRLLSAEDNGEILSSVARNARLKHRRRHLSTGDGEPIIRYDFSEKEFLKLKYITQIT